MINIYKTGLDRNYEKEITFIINKVATPQEAFSYMDGMYERAMARKSVKVMFYQRHRLGVHLCVRLSSGRDVTFYFSTKEMGLSSTEMYHLILKESRG